jgi:hypothetical protein
MLQQQGRRLPALRPDGGLAARGIGRHQVEQLRVLVLLLLMNLK